MNVNATCPYCQTPAATPCPHLALAAGPRDFVGRCVAACHGESAWQGLCKSNEKADFTWLETAFADRFLKPLDWFGSLEHEWRTVPKSRRRDVWTLLWSLDPQKLWWELRDHLEAQLQQTPILPPPNPVRCPVCGKSPVETECEHLVIHGDDLSAADIVSLYNPRASWTRLHPTVPGTPDDAATFLEKFAAQFPSLTGIERRPWQGETLGFKSDYLYVWAEDPEAFVAEVGKLLQAA